ncbi:MAG: hypothetical protein JWM11_2465 [Planctomycetaceae bacterium]|nr:hypothetical protein [Planctomycetaceae bacterium]
MIFSVAMQKNVEESGDLNLILSWQIACHRFGEDYDLMRQSDRLAGDSN